MSVVVASPEAASAPSHRKRGWLPALGVAIGGYAALCVALLAAGLLIVGVGEELGIEAFDDGSTEWIADRRSAVLDGVSGIFSAWADTWTIIGGVIGVIGALLPARAWRRAAVIAVAIVLEISVFLSVTYIVGRSRPDVEKLSSVPSTGSFPSGHIAAAVVLYGGLAMLAWPLTRTRWIRIAVAVAAGVLVPLAVGWSRWYRGLHHPTDLVAGALLGVACLLLAVRVARRLVPEDPASTP